MKKILILTAVIILVSLSVYGQTTNPIYLGARAGLNLGNATLDPDVASGASKSARTGIAAGAYSEFGVAEGLAITAEALYVQGGFKESESGFEGTFKWDAITVPVNLKYKFAIQNSQVKPFIFGGGNVAFTMKSEFENPDGSTTDYKDSTESVGFGLQFGAGVEYEVSPGVNLFLDGQYGLGLKNLDKTSGGQSIKPTDIAIMLGLSFKVN